MSTTITNNWYEANQRYLSAALALVRNSLERQVEHLKNMRPAATQSGASGVSAPEETSAFVRARFIGSDAPLPIDSLLEEIASSMSTTPALETLCSTFSLSPFERDILLLCAGMELDSTIATLCASAQNDPMRAYPTFSLALTVLSDPHWSALAPSASLRRWRLIEVGAGSVLTQSPLRIDERVLHYLVGVQHMDERLAGLVEPVRSSRDLVPSHYALAEHLAMIWSRTMDTSLPPAMQLCGNEVASKRAIAATACDMLGLNLSVVSAHIVPQAASELDAFIRLWEREAALSGSALLIDCDEMDVTDAARTTITNLVERVRGGLIISSRERRQVPQRPIITVDVRKPSPSEQRMVWQQTLGDATYGLNGQVEVLVSQFSLNASTIHAVGAEVLGSQVSTSAERAISDDDPGKTLWDACRMQARPRLDDLAQRIESVARWEDLVLPEQQRQVLRDIVAHVRQRAKVYETWGFAARSSRGMGISTLFTGASGTGKTMAAEVIANELWLDLYHIDLSQIVSKYIGETEKNLRRVFDAAEEGGAILLFDEADALFGKRSEVKDSHDRYANIEVSYLLQRMESYRGLAVLTTNMKSALDTAFLRRIRFIIQFPFPDVAQRTEIWRRIFPPSTPTEGLDLARLARLNVTGGNIRNIALNAAFLAADVGEPVRMTHILRAARSEYAKLEKALTEAEIGGWV